MSPAPLRRPVRLAALVALVATVALGASACGNDDKDVAATTSAPDRSGLEGTAWVLVSRDDAGTAVPGSTDPPSTLAFATGGALDGSTGCNSFAGKWRAEGDQLTVELGPMTRMACTDPAVQAQEDALAALFAQVQSFTLDGDNLALTDDAGTVLLTYRPQDDELAASRWTVTGVNTGTALQGTDASAGLTAEFAEGGSFSGSGGCNRLMGSWESGDTSISITGLAGSMMSCEPDIAAMETAYIAALQAATTYEVRGDTLTLRDDAEAMQVTAVRAG